MLTREGCKPAQKAAMSETGHSAVGSPGFAVEEAYWGELGSKWLNPRGGMLRRGASRPPVEVETARSDPDSAAAGAGIRGGICGEIGDGYCCSAATSWQLARGAARAGGGRRAIDEIGGRVRSGGGGTACVELGEFAGADKRAFFCGGISSLC